MKLVPHGARAGHGSQLAAADFREPPRRATGAATAGSRVAQGRPAGGPPAGCMPRRAAAAGARGDAARGASIVLRKSSALLPCLRSLARAAPPAAHTHTPRSPAAGAPRMHVASRAPRSVQSSSSIERHGQNFSFSLQGGLKFFSVERSSYARVEDSRGLRPRAECILGVLRTQAMKSIEYARGRLWLTCDLPR